MASLTGLALPLLVAVPLAGIVAMLFAWGRPVASAWIALVTSLAALAAAAALVAEFAPVTPVEQSGPVAPVAPVAQATRVPGAGLPVHEVGGWPPPFGIALAPDRLGLTLAVLTGFLFSCGTAYHLGRTLLERRAATGAAGPHAVYPLAFPLLLLALLGLFTTGDLFNFYVFFELLAVSSYMLVALGKHEPIEAAWKYSAQSVVGSVSLLVGVALLYGRTGSLDLHDIALRLDEPALVAAPFFLLAFLLKAAVFPFHFWQPDAHAAATTEGSMILAGVLIKVGLFGLMRLGPILFGDRIAWLLLTIGGATILFGAAAAWRQADAKRLLGFSSVSQLGFVLVAIGWGTEGALAAAVFFVVAHSLAKALLFMATGFLADPLGSTEFAVLQGRGASRPLAAAAYLAGVLSLAGLPLTAGFVAKVGVLRQGVELGSWAIVGVAVLGSLLTLAYGLRAFQLLFWANPPAQPAPPAPPAHWAGKAALTVLATAVVALGLAPGPLWALCEAAARDVAGGSYRSATR